MLSLVLSACQDYELAPEPADPAGVGDPPVDTSSDTDPDTATGTDTVVTVPGDCAQEWPALTVPVSETCVVPAADWDLTTAWSWSDPDAWGQALLARPSDTDGDGLITVADRPGIWLVPMALAAWGSGIWLLDSDGGVLATDRSIDGSWRSYSAVGAVDAHPGVDLLTSYNIYRDTAYLAFSDASGIHETRRLDGSAFMGTPPWLTDLEGDGTVDVILGPAVFDVDGNLRLGLYRGKGDATHLHAAADLDRDGVEELLGMTEDGDAGVWRIDGTRVGTCLSGVFQSEGYAAFGVGNLDEDPDGELIVIGNGILALCDADGTLIRSVATNGFMGELPGIAQLDGDPEPEIVVDYNESDRGTLEGGIVAYDLRLDELWRSPSDPGWGPFQLADLDGDGRHEILTLRDRALEILAPDGTLLARREDVGDYNYWMAAPSVMDVDQDGLAEIVVAGVDESVVVVENTSGGWAIHDATVPMPTIGGHPYARDVAGTVPGPLDWWNLPGGNVWQGLAAGPPRLPDIGLQLAEVCDDECRSVTFSLYVTNSGQIATSLPIRIELSSVTTGAVLGEAEVPAPLGPGVGVSVTLSVDASLVVGGVEARADLGAMAECDGDVTSVVVTDLPCP